MCCSLANNDWLQNFGCVNKLVFMCLLVCMHRARASDKFYGPR